MEIITNLKKESLKSAGNEAKTAAPQQVLALPPPPQQSFTQLPTRTSSVSSTASFTSSSSSLVATPTNKVTPSQNGDTHTAFETKHETVVS